MMSWRVLWLKKMNESSCSRSRLPLYSCSEGIGSLMAVCLTELCARGWLFPGLHHFNACFMVMFCEHPLSPPSSLYRYQRLLRFWRTDLFLLCRGAVVLGAGCTLELPGELLNISIKSKAPGLGLRHWQVLKTPQVLLMFIRDWKHWVRALAEAAYLNF